MFGTKGTEIESGNAPRAYFKPGIHVAKIANVEYVETTGGTPKILVTFEGKPHGGEFTHPKGYKGSTAETDLWLTEGAMQYTNQTLAYMGSQLDFRDELDAISADNGEEYAAKLKPLMVGKVGRWKFAGKEIKSDGVDDQGKPKNNWWKSQLAKYRFVEPTTITDAESKMKFDENNHYDMIPLKESDGDVASKVDTAFAGESDDEPW